MVKNRNKKKKEKLGAAPMDITSEREVIDVPQDMDTSEATAPRKNVGAVARRQIKGVQMKRSKNVRKMKAIAKAISKSEIEAEKVLKHESKTSRVQSAKKLYD